MSKNRKRRRKKGDAPAAPPRLNQIPVLGGDSKSLVESDEIVDQVTNCGLRRGNVNIASSLRVQNQGDQWPGDDREIVHHRRLLLRSSRWNYRRLARCNFSRRRRNGCFLVLVHKISYN